jgi:hypothetical protein
MKGRIGRLAAGATLSTVVAALSGTRSSTPWPTAESGEIAAAHLPQAMR